MKITFAEQAEKFLREGANRKRNPLRPASLRTYKAQIDTHLLPLLGKMPLQDVGNKVVSEVVQKLSEKGLSPRTIGLNVMILKKIRKSAVNEDGNQLFPITWNAEVIDAPAMDDTKQPTVSAQQVQDAMSKAGKYQKALYALLAGTGLRIAEALSIKMGPDNDQDTVWIPAESKIIVRKQRGRHGDGPVKTKAGYREIDLAPELNNLLSAAFIDLFTAKYGPNALLFGDCESCYRNTLKKDGIEGGFHAFRRFRVTHLRMNGVPEPLVQYWTGHAAGNITEHYTQVAGEIESRKQHATKAGLGFQLPEVL